MINIMGTEEYEDSKKNYGDCIVYIEKGTAIIYDCGSEEHAERVIKLLDEHDIDKAIVVLSHNDSDHFQGISYLIEQKRVEVVFTVLLLKYTDELLDKINDGRRKKDSIIKAIKDTPAHNPSMPSVKLTALASAIYSKDINGKKMSQ